MADLSTQYKVVLVIVAVVVALISAAGVTATIHGTTTCDVYDPSRLAHAADDDVYDPRKLSPDYWSKGRH